MTRPYLLDCGLDIANSGNMCYAVTVVSNHNNNIGKSGGRDFLLIQSISYPKLKCAPCPYLPSNCIAILLSYSYIDAFITMYLPSSSFEGCSYKVAVPVNTYVNFAKGLLLSRRKLEEVASLFLITRLLTEANLEKYFSDFPS